MCGIWSYEHLHLCKFNKELTASPSPVCDHDMHIPNSKAVHGESMAIDSLRLDRNVPVGHH